MRLALLLVLATAAHAQSGPHIGTIPDAFDQTPGVTAYLHPETNPEATVFRYDADRGTIVVDGRSTTVRPVGRSREETAVEAGTGIRRGYSVQLWRPRDRSFEVEVWERSIGDDEAGGDCTEIRGGITVRKRGRTTHLRVTGEACQFGALAPGRRYRRGAPAA